VLHLLRRLLARVGDGRDDLDALGQCGARGRLVALACTAPHHSASLLHARSAAKRTHSVVQHAAGIRQRGYQR
jgi:hypothetical protein